MRKAIPYRFLDDEKGARVGVEPQNLTEDIGAAGSIRLGETTITGLAWGSVTARHWNTQS